MGLGESGLGRFGIALGGDQAYIVCIDRPGLRLLFVHEKIVSGRIDNCKPERWIVGSLAVALWNDTEKLMISDAKATLWVDSGLQAARMDSMPETGKLQPIEALRQRLSERRAEGEIVQTHGTFDLLHIGAVRHLEQARQLGCVLVVTITSDADLLRAGTRLPLFNQDLRAEALAAALGCVDYVAIAKQLFPGLLAS